MKEQLLQKALRDLELYSPRPAFRLPSSPSVDTLREILENAPSVKPVIAYYSDPDDAEEDEREEQKLKEDGERPLCLVEFHY
ncbi:hypothetical protein Hypma_002364 [Hypsizygus marmoreus]|uniref:Uncharacterized protein n=1 Tax=Hypsizygus marmoreus TaxID=39966 RepID=A0A369J897_HYPMA|nr:hypothetical protein Hypma_002364 [Hypsizygus marmoreus]